MMSSLPHRESFSAYGFRPELRIDGSGLGLAAQISTPRQLVFWEAVRTDFVLAARSNKHCCQCEGQRLRLRKAARREQLVLSESKKHGLCIIRSHHWFRNACRRIRSEVKALKGALTDM